MIAAGVAMSLLMGGSAVAAPPAPRLVNGWLPYWSMDESLESVTDNADLWSSASPFWYQATGATTLRRHRGAGDRAVVDALRDENIAVIPSVTESLDTLAMAALLRGAGQRAAHVRMLTDLVTTNGYDGIDLDYEAMNFGGTRANRQAVRAGFVTLVAELKTALDAEDKVLTVTVGPRTRADDPNWLVFDYHGIAAAADRVRIMTYDYHWRGGRPGAVAPLTWVEKVLTYAVTAIPAGKIEAGVPLYGYDWPADPTQSDGYGNAATLTQAGAERLRERHHAPRQRSAATAAPSFTYTDPNGVHHQVWYNDAESTRAKTALIEKYALRGLAFWAVGDEDTGHWPALRTYATLMNQTKSRAG
jgi:spore germination protein YaaH